MCLGLNNYVRTKMKCKRLFFRDYLLWYAGVILWGGIFIAASQAGMTAGEGFIGIYSSNLDDAMYEALGLEDDGIMVDDVVKDSPAEKAGIKPGDILLEVAGKKMTSAARLGRVVRSFEPGKEIEVKVWRDRKIINLKVTLSEQGDNEIMNKRKSKKPHAFKIFEDYDDDDDNLLFFQGNCEPGVWLGVQIESLNDQLGNFFGVKNGEGCLVMEVEDESPANAAGILAGDVIVEIAGEKIEDSEDLIEELEDFKDGDKVEVVLIRDKKEKKIDVVLKEKPEKFHKSSIMQGFDLDDLEQNTCLYVKKILKDIDLDRLKDLDLESGEMEEWKEKLEKNMETLKKDLEELKEEIKKQSK